MPEFSNSDCKVYWEKSQDTRGKIGIYSALWLATNCCVVLDLMLAFGCCFNGFIFNSHPKNHCAVKCLQSSATKLMIFQCWPWPAVLIAKERPLLFKAVTKKQSLWKQQDMVGRVGWVFCMCFHFK